MEQDLMHVPLRSKNSCLGSFDGAKWSFDILSETPFHNKKALDFISSKADTDLYYRKQVKTSGDNYYEYLLAYVDDILCLLEHTKPIMRWTDWRRTVWGHPSDILVLIRRSDKWSMGNSVERCHLTRTWERPFRMSRFWWNMTVRRRERPCHHFQIRTITLNWTHHRCLMHQWCLDISSLLGSYDGVANWAAWISCWKCYYCPHLLQHLVRAILMHCTTSSATWRHIQAVLLHLILRYRIMMLRWSNRRAGKNSTKLLTCRYLRMHPNHVDSQWRWPVLSMHLMPPIRQPTDPILGYSFCWIMHPWCGYRSEINTVKSSTFGPEFVALRVTTELIEGLRYKLRMFGVPIDSATSVYCDNQSVIKTAAVPASTLSKKHNSGCYHKVIGSVVSGWISIAWIKSQDNLADLFTKVLPRVTWNDLIDKMMIRWARK